MINYYQGMVAMKVDADTLDLICEDELSFEVQGVYYECMNEESEDDDATALDWKMDSVLVVRNKQVVKYMKSTFSELLLKDDNGEYDWVDGRVARILGVGTDDADDVRAANEYRIEEYDLENSLKRRYKVVLEGTYNMGEYELKEIKEIADKGNNNLTYL